jgi:hypothetical protein
VVYTTQESKVKIMTSAFSLSSNAGLKKAMQSFGQLSASLAALSRGTAGGSHQVQDVFAALRTVGARAGYSLAGTSQQGDATLVYDDETRELTGIRGKDLALAFTFKNEGASRAWSCTIVKSPDGTTGTFSVQATGAWHAFDMPASAAFKLAGNEYPAYVETATFDFKVKPKGDPTLAFTLSGTVDDPENLPNSSLRMPTHWVLKGAIPSIVFDWESRLDLAPGHSKFDGAGTMTVSSEAGRETFQYQLAFDERQRSGAFNLINLGAKLRLGVTSKQPSLYGPPSIDAALYSTEDGRQVGEVAMDPRRPRFMVITLNDGSTLDWELYPEDMALPMAGFMPPSAPNHHNEPPVGERSPAVMPAFQGRVTKHGQPVAGRTIFLKVWNGASEGTFGGVSSNRTEINATTDSNGQYTLPLTAEQVSAGGLFSVAYDAANTATGGDPNKVSAANMTDEVQWFFSPPASLNNAPYKTISVNFDIGWAINGFTPANGATLAGRSVTFAMPVKHGATKYEVLVNAGNIAGSGSRVFSEISTTPRITWNDATAGNYIYTTRIYTQEGVTGIMASSPNISFTVTNTQ